ncbi:MAG: hypothetical protein O7B77_07250 [Actinobacteria bacterium]|nr:hypothetical protein [Actinomycetota bacterium]
MTAVWFNVLFGDSRDKWDPDLMPDDRVTHFWVDDQDVARWFFDHREEIGFGFHGGGIVWDSSCSSALIASGKTSPATSRSSVTRSSQTGRI